MSDQPPSSSGASSQCRSTWGSAGDNKSPEAPKHRARAARQRDKLMPDMGGTPPRFSACWARVLAILRLVSGPRVLSKLSENACLMNFGAVFLATWWEVVGSCQCLTTMVY